MNKPRLIVYEPDARGWRRVRYDGVILGTAHRASDILEFLRAAGHEDPDSVDLTDPQSVEWRGPGPASWAESPP